MRSEFLESFIKNAIVVAVVLAGAAAVVWLVHPERLHRSNARAQRITSRAAFITTKPGPHN
jgi:hypothetical protein